MRTWKGIGLLALLAALMVVQACNDHTFTPKAEIEVYPTSLTFEEQAFDYSEASAEENGRKYRPKEILLSNVSVSANLGLMEIDFANSEDDSLDVEAREVGEDEGGEMTYALANIIPNSNCSTDEECVAAYGDDSLVCSAKSTDDQTTVCQYPHKFYFTLTYNLDELVNVDPSVLINKEQAAKLVYKPCYLDKEVEGETTIDVMKCEYENQSGNGSCLYKAPVTIGEDGSITTDTENITYECSGMAKPVLDQDLTGSLAPCLSDGSSIDLYGLNKCDRLALIERFKKVDDEVNTEDVELENGMRANYRLFRSSIPNYQLGQVHNVSYCGDAENNDLSISGDLWQLDDPMVAESCYLESGDIDSSKLSVDIDKVKIDQLPIAVNYVLGKDQDVPSALTGKEYRMRIYSSADIGGSAARVVTLNINENLGRPPEPFLQLHEDYRNEIKIADLNGIKLDASESISHMGEERLPFKYKYRWGSAGKPTFAKDSVLTCSICDLINPTDIMSSESSITDSEGWSDDATPKIFIPVAGVYSFELKVKDNQELESGPTAGCPECEEWYTLNLNIKPSEKIHIELTWDQGGDTDMDLYLIRYRDDGTMGIAYPNAVIPESPPTLSCGTGTPCPDDASGNPFTCGDDGFCDWNCTSDDDCLEVPAAGLVCNSGVCQKRSGSEISCETDDDCGGYYCNVKQYLSEDRICTAYPWEALNDTCNYTNRNPRWTEDPTEMPDSDAPTLSYPNLDIDDVTGYGPENVSLKEPLPGRYRIVARLYSAGIVEGGSDPIVTDSNPAKATVNVYLNGDLVLDGGTSTAEMEFVRSGVYWKIGDIVWEGTGEDGSGEFTALDTASGAAEDFSANPYANPFYSPLSIFDPNKSTNPRSIWCDAPADEYKDGVTCAELYAGSK